MPSIESQISDFIEHLMVSLHVIDELGPEFRKKFEMEGPTVAMQSEVIRALQKHEMDTDA